MGLPAQPNLQWLAPEAEEVVVEEQLPMEMMQAVQQQHQRKKNRNQNHHLQPLEVDCSEEMIQIPMTAHRKRKVIGNGVGNFEISVFKLIGLVQQSMQARTRELTVALL